MWAERPGVWALFELANAGAQMAMFPCKWGKMAISFDSWPYGHEEARRGGMKKLSH